MCGANVAGKLKTKAFDDASKIMSWDDKLIAKVNSFFAISLSALTRYSHLESDKLFQIIDILSCSDDVVVINLRIWETMEQHGVPELLLYDYKKQNKLCRVLMGPPSMLLCNILFVNVLTKQIVIEVMEGGALAKRELRMIDPLKGEKTAIDFKWLPGLNPRWISPLGNYLV